MSERELRADRSPPADDETDVRGLLEAAGPRPAIPAEDLEAIAAAARSAWRMQVHRHRRAASSAPARRAWTVALAVAATLAAVLGLGGWWASTRVAPVAATVARVETVTGGVVIADGGGSRPLAEGDEIPAGATLTTLGASGGAADDAGRVALRLAGGHTVRLDSGSELRLASAASVELARGEMYAASGPGAGRSGGIEVHTPLGTARDVGTQFTVAVVGPDAEAVRVRVREGAVVVQRDGQSYRTEPGEELLVLRDDGVERREIAAYGDTWAWVVAAAPPFSGRTLADLLGWVEAEAGWRVRFESPELAETAGRIVLYGGVGDLRADEAALAVLPGAGLEGQLDDGVLTVRRPR